MARPTTLQDLTDYDRRGPLVFSWNTSNVMLHPVIAEHIVQAAKTAQFEGLEIVNDGVYEVLTLEQLEAKLLEAQKSWDHLKSRYEVVSVEPSKVADLWSINNWASKNGRPKIEVEEETKVKADLPF